MKISIIKTITVAILIFENIVNAQYNVIFVQQQSIPLIIYNATAFAAAEEAAAGGPLPASSGSIDTKNPQPEKMILNYTTILVAPP